MSIIAIIATMVIVYINVDTRREEIRREKLQEKYNEPDWWEKYPDLV